jgi:predicted deacylase
MKNCQTFLILMTFFLTACVTQTPVSSTATDAQVTEVIPTQAVIASPLPTNITMPVTSPSPSASPELTLTVTIEPTPTATIEPTSTATVEPTPTATPARVWSLGFSSKGNPIDVYRFGQGPVAIVLIGGIHGGYEWNTSLLAYEVLDYFEQFPSEVPSNFSLYIIPVANPDGLATIVGHNGRFSETEIPASTVAGRFNGNGVDLNRNWDCKWKQQAQWRTETINAGSAPFSEPETRLLRDFLVGLPAGAVVWWHSAMPGVFAGGCKDNFPASLTLAGEYSDGSVYPVQKEFVSYDVTGDASDWLSLQGIPSISVELSTHTDTEFKRNLAGVLSVLNLFQASTATAMPLKP